MANPLLDMHFHSPSEYGAPVQDGASHEVRDLLDFDDKSELSVVALILVATAFIFLLKWAGFRAMIAVGRD